MTTPAEFLLRRIRRACRVESFTVHLGQRRAELRLCHGTRHLPPPIDTVAFFTALTGDACDRIEVHIGSEIAQVHQLVDGIRRWRTTTVESADEEVNHDDSPPIASALQDRPALQRVGAAP